MRAREFITESFGNYSEIEFICVNKDVPGSTDPKDQEALFQSLKKVPGIVVYRQDFDEDEDQFSGGKSMAAIIVKGGNSTVKKVKALAAQHNVKIDLINQTSDSFIDRLYNGSEPSVTDWYDNSTENELDEMALPADWDPAALGHDKSFKSRLEYALQRAPRLGGGSSRVAFVIPDQGRETVLKIAKNKKGMAQNEAELEVLDDGYLGKLDIVIPLIDYDKANPTPTWIQTEKANKVSQQKLAKMLHAGGRWPMTNFLYAVDNVLGNRKKYMPDLIQIEQEMIDTGSSEQDIEIFMDYVNQVADLVNSSNLLAADFGTASNWGEYQGKPVIIDLGYTSSVRDLYWGKR